MVCQVSKKTQEIQNIKSVCLTTMEKVYLYRERFKCTNQMNY